MEEIILNLTMFKQKNPLKFRGFCLWAHLGSNQGLSDYESDTPTKRSIYYALLFFRFYQSSATSSVHAWGLNAKPPKLKICYTLLFLDTTLS